MTQRDLLVIGGDTGVGAEVTKLALGMGYRDVLGASKAMLDVRDRNSVKLLAWDARTTDLDIIYCAGLNQLGALGNLNHTVLQQHFEVNVIGFITVLDEFMRTHGHKRVNVTAIVSDASRVAMRGSIQYASSKAALAHAIRCAARELAPRWRVNGVSPGIIDDTPMTERVEKEVCELRGWTPEQAREYEMSLVPMGRRATKQEVALLALAITDGPEFMTGSIVEITGGK